MYNKNDESALPLRLGVTQMLYDVTRNVVMAATRV